MSTRRLPIVLDQLRIATPCHARWDEMPGDQRVRFCGQCEKHVYNLSALSRAEGEALVAAHEGRMCVRFFRRADGTTLTADCPVGVRRQQWRARAWARISRVMAASALVLGAWSGRARADLALTDGKKAAPQRRPMMGAMVALPVAKPIAKPVAQPVAKPVAQPAAKPVAKPVAVPEPEELMGDMIAD